MKQLSNGSACNSTSKMSNETPGSAFKQTIDSSADSTVCQIGSNQLQMRSINNGLIWQEMFSKPSARKG